uniref:Uncharacterized protein n=1 Tax=Graphocephala atropunctata TaxID=36148 RepID=A0A1B6LAA7_9HEMI
MLEAHSNLYVYGFSGELLTTLAVSDFIAVEGEYVVYITYASVLNIWTCRTPNVATITLDLGPDRSIGRNIVSGSLLVLSYFDHFKVIDIQKGSFIYDVEFGARFSASFTRLVSESCYVLFKQIKVNKHQSSLSDSPSTTSTMTLERTQDNNIQTEKHLVVFDFRANTRRP